MYSDNLYKIGYFKKLKQINPNIKIEDLLDPLTGVLLRKHILDYAEYLVDSNTPFSLEIIDIDNFKRINDNYGHHVGDVILKTFGERLFEAIGESGLIGRFGGDEFIVVVPGITEYNDVWQFIGDHLFLKSGAPMRCRYKVDIIETSITGTVGSVSFPNNAKTLDELFIMADKALYRGKQKGRNCFIIYVDEKHRNINVNEGTRRLLSNTIVKCDSIIDRCDTFESCVKELNRFLLDTFGITEFIYLPKDSECSVLDKFLDKHGFISCTAKENLSGRPELEKFLNDNNIISMIFIKSVIRGNNLGYFALTEGRLHRIWQDEDIALLMYLSKVLGFLLNNN